MFFFLLHTLQQPLQAINRVLRRFGIIFIVAKSYTGENLVASRIRGDVVVKGLSKKTIDPSKQTQRYDEGAVIEGVLDRDSTVLQIETTEK